MRVVVGVSGGADSVCLLHALVHLPPELAVEPIAATLDHQLRGDSGAQDALFVAECARQWGVEAVSGAFDVPGLASERGLGIEETGRMARYTFLARTAHERGAEVIAVAHHADDQAETVLMHLLRGSGPGGLAGMRPETPLGGYDLLEPVGRGLTVIRPLLTVTRAEIDAYCAAYGLSPRFDRSNLDTSYFRNRVRHEVLPYLERISPNLRELLARMAEVMAGDVELLEGLLNRTWPHVTLENSPERVRFDLEAWRTLPVGLRRLTLRRAAFQLRPELTEIGFATLEQAVTIASAGDAGAQSVLPGGLVMRVDYDTLILGAYERPPDWPLLWFERESPLHVPGVFGLPESPWQLEIRPGKPGEGPDPDRPWRAVLREGERFTLRGRLPGDRFSPSGMDGHTQKVADFMSNARIPVDWRDRIPLLIVDGMIGWVCGWRVSEELLVPDGETPKWVVEWKK
jgi:tRNA(Ile)-lysidine synthase